MKKTKTIFWSSTVLIFLFEGVMPAFTSQTELAKEGIRHLGYPDYFGIALTVCKILGTLAIIVPQVPGRLKEWAYAGLTFDFTFAAISIWAVDGFGPTILIPVVVFAVLMVSYTSYHKLQKV